MKTQKEIWTIGHSTRTAEDFLKLLKAHRIGTLADVRNYPGSRRYPHFNKERLEEFLSGHQICYQHFKDLGGRRTPAKDSVNTAWRHRAFRGYADYMQTEAFTRSIAELQVLARNGRTAIMCSEAVWWSCHRSLISDFLKAQGWTVWHIMDEQKLTEHPYTKPARVVNGVLRYDQPSLFD